MDNGKLINIDIIYFPNTDTVTNLEKYTLAKPHIILVLFNQTNLLFIIINLKLKFILVNL